MSSVIVSRLDSIRNILLGTSPEIAPKSYASEEHTPNTDATVKTTRSKLGFRGTLTSVAIDIISGVPFNNLYCKITLEDQYQRPRAILCKGYSNKQDEINGNGSLPVDMDWSLRLDTICTMSTAPKLRLYGSFLATKLQAGGWSGVQGSSLDGMGNIRQITGSDPATGANFSESVPTNRIWKISSVKWDVVVGSSAVSMAIQLKNSDGDVISQTDRIEMTAEGDYGNVVFFNNPYATKHATVGSAVFYNFPNDVIIPQGFTIQSANVSNDEEISSPLLTVYEYLDLQ